MKKQIVIGTKNKDKLRELQKLLKGAGIRVLSLGDFPPCRDVKENGKTFEANARKKARVYSKHTGLLTLGDDSGLMVRALNGKPGVYSARFAWPGCSYSDNNKKLLRLMKGLKGGKRQAKFVCVAALYDKGKFVGLARGECAGQIARSLAGKNGFGYDPVFVPSGLKKTFAELLQAAKARVSHRGRALRAASKVIRRYVKS